jgi:hypothetical protein
VQCRVKQRRGTVEEGARWHACTRACVSHVVGAWQHRGDGGACTRSARASSRDTRTQNPTTTHLGALERRWQGATQDSPVGAHRLPLQQRQGQPAWRASDRAHPTRRVRGQCQWGAGCHESSTWARAFSGAMISARLSLPQQHPARGLGANVESAQCAVCGRWQVAGVCVGEGG